MSTKAGSARRVWLLNAALVAIGAGLYAGAVHPMPAGGAKPWMTWWLLAAAFAATEVFVVHLPFRKESESFSLSELPLVFGLFFASPQTLILAQIVGAVGALVLKRKQPVKKLVFNVAHFVIEACVAVIIFRAMSRGGLDAMSTAGAFVAMLATIAIGVCCVVLAISISESEFRHDMFRRVLGLGWIVSTTNTALAVLGVLVVRNEPALAWLLLVPATTLFFAYRAYTSESQKRRGVEMLYTSTRSLQRSLHLDETVRTLLDEARDIFRAEVAWVTFFPDTVIERPVRFVVRADGELGSYSPDLDPREGLWARVASEGQAVLAARPIRNERIRAYYAKDGLRDLMVAPLFRDDQVVGTVLVGNRLGDVATFDQDDLRLFETLVNHAGIALVNARLVSKLEEALHRQTELNRLKDDFVANVSHELRTPLTSIKGFVHTLLRPGVVADPEQRHHCLEVIQRQADRLQVLIEDLLLVSQIESDRVHTSWARVALEPLLDELVEEFGPRAPGALSLNVIEPLPAITSDPEILHRIISNLIDNAVKYSPEAPRVNVTAAGGGGGVTITVEDNGVGVPEDMRDKIFDRFFQVDGSRTRSVGGAGLGLFLSRELAQAIGGRLELGASSGRGSIFTLRLPARPEMPFAQPAEARTIRSA